MKLYITLYSPYARMARIMLAEKGLESSIETIIARTREIGSPYYKINPSGRVPYLVRDDGVGMEDSQLICSYLDHCKGSPKFMIPQGNAGWELWRLEALGRTMVEGASVWIRELLRREEERSPTIIDHEQPRLQRLADTWEEEIDNPFMHGQINMVQITLACALQLEIWNPEFEWRKGHPLLVEWLNTISDRSSLSTTEPPGPLSK